MSEEKPESEHPLLAGTRPRDLQVPVFQPTQHCRAEGYPQRNFSRPSPATGNTEQTSGLKPAIQKTRNTNSVATQQHFSLRLWNSIEKQQSSRGRNRIQFSRATLNRLHHEAIVIFLQLPASFTAHLLILTNKRSGSPIGESLL